MSSVFNMDGIATLILNFYPLSVKLDPISTCDRLSAYSKL